MAAENQHPSSLSPQAQQHQQQQQHQLEALHHRRRLLLTQAPPECTAELIKAWLNQFGTVEELQMYGVNGAVLGSNCGLVTMATSESAAAVMAAVLGNMQLPAIFKKLSVSWVVQSDDHGCLSSDNNAMPSSLAANADRTVRACTCCDRHQLGHDGRQLPVSTTHTHRHGLHGSQRQIYYQLSSYHCRVEAQVEALRQLC